MILDQITDWQKAERSGHSGDNCVEVAIVVRGIGVGAA